MAPFSIIYIMNWIIFILILVSLLRKKKNIGKTKSEKKAMMAKLKQQFIIALTLSLLFGLGWGVGFAATTSIPIEAISFTLQAIFIILTGFQGLLIFIMHCLRSEDARKEWKAWISIVTCHRINLDSHKKMKFTSQSGTSGESRKRSTLSTAASDSDTLRKAVMKDMERSAMYSNKSAIYSNSSLETIEEAEKKDLSLTHDEKDKYKLYPHQEEEEDGHTASASGGSESPASSKSEESPYTDKKLLISALQGDVTSVDLNSVKSLEVISPGPKELPKEEEKVQDKFNVLWVDGADKDVVIANTELSEFPASPTFNVFINGNGFGAEDTAL